MAKNAEVPYQIKAVALIFFIMGGLGLLSLFLLNSGYLGPKIISITKSGAEYIALPGAAYRPIEISRQSIPASGYYLLITLVTISSILYVLEGILLLRLIKFSFWLGIILSVFMALNPPTGTILAIVNIYLLSKSKSIFYQTKKLKH